MRAHFRLCRTGLLSGAALTLLACRPATASTVLPMTLEETVRGAEAICVGRVLGHESRWLDASRQTVVTDYRVWVEETLRPTPQVRAGAILALPFWGGTIGTRTQEAAGVPLPVDGERYVMMLRRDWQKLSFSPIVGVHHGLFRLERPEPAVDELLIPAEGAPAYPGLRLHELRRWLKGGSGLSARGSQPRVSLRDGLTRAEGAPPAESQEPRAESPPPPTLGRGVRLAAGFVPAVAEAPRARFQHHTHFQPASYLQINQFPPGHPWAGEDQHAMTKWNYYVDIFRIRNDPTPADNGSRRLGNGVHDLIGWWDDATLRANSRAAGQESNWDPGQLGVTLLQLDRVAGRVLVEADIIFNFSEVYAPVRINWVWTLDEELLYSGRTQVPGGTPASFREVMLHELGHVLGFQHQTGTLSVMSYPELRYRAFSFPYMDDAEGVRARYPALAQPRTDLGVYLYRWQNGNAAFQDWREANFSRTVRPGGTISVSDYHVENAGTTAIEMPTIEWYLTGARSFASTYYALGSTTYPRLDRFQSFRPNSVATTFTVPAGTPAGSYYLAAFIRDDGGPSQATFPFGNNMAFSQGRLQVTP
jgi:hypothetical protein